VWREVVGIVGDVHQWGLARAPLPEVYFPHSQSPQSVMRLVIRSTVEPNALAKAVRAEVRELDQDLPVIRPITMESILSQSTTVPRFQALLMGIFGALALTLVTVGVYGVMSYTVAQHTREIGIRVALGARAADVLKLIIGHGMLLALTGMVIGLVGAFALTRLMTGLLFGVSATDPITFAAIAVLLALAALLACLVPARRATKTDPMVALRYE
jgi:putative ABC transport system permease protein